MPDGKKLPNYDTCTKLTDFCRVEFTAYGDFFTKGACIFFAVSYLILLAAQVFYCFKGRTWSFSIWLAIGTGFELLGYAARSLMVENPWKINPFIVQYLTLLLAPTLVAASVSITFKHLVIWYGPEWSVMRPKLYPWVFVGADVLSIGIQVVGGGIMTSNATGDGGSESSRKLAEVLLIGGVIFQVANMVCCGALMLLYYRRRKNAQSLAAPHSQQGSRENFEGNGLMSSKQHSPSHESPGADKVRLFVRIISVAYVAIIIRCCYRIPEMIPSIGDKIAKNETLFLIFDGAMILIAVGCVTVFHPALYFPFLGKKGVRQAQVPQTQMEPVPYQPVQPYPVPYQQVQPYPVQYQQAQPYDRPGAYEMSRMP